jgi:2-aminoadipate transaminase
VGQSVASADAASAQLSTDRDMSNTSIWSTEEAALAGWARAIKPSDLQEMLLATAQPGIISFALGLPAPELFPREALLRAAAAVLEGDVRSLQYGPPSSRLKQQIVRMMERRGVACHEGQIFLTAGAQQGMNLLTRLFLEPAGQVLVEEMIYTGFQQVLEPYQPHLLTVSADPETGMDVSGVESILARGARPAFIYAISEGHNPLSVSLSLPKRRRLAELAREYRIPIIEDDAYGFLYYHETPDPPLRAFDNQWIFYIGSFSKTLAPGLRSGWIVLPELLAPKLSIVKEASDIDTTTFAQRMVAAFLESEDFDRHLARLRGEYKIRRDTMLRSLRDHFPAGARWMIPQAGAFIWVKLPPEIDASALLKVAIEKERVAFIPGRAFCVNGTTQARSCLRLNFSNSPPDLIEKGIQRLARAVGSL